MIEFKLPSMGADMDEGKLLEWKVAPGDTVRKGAVMAVVDTSKAAVDVEIWQDGTVAELLAEPGERIAVGTVIARLLEPGEKGGSKPAEPARPAAEPRTVAATPAPAPVAGPTGAPLVPVARRRISPAARKRAAELRLDLESVAGTGPDGAVTLADVEAAGQEPPPRTAAAAPAAASGGDRYAEMRRAIAAAMSRSKREIPHYYLAETVPLVRLLDWLTVRNAGRPVTERLLPAVPLLKAVALATRNFPDMNGFFRDGRFEPVPAAHLGVAISLRQGGLIAPAIHDVADKPLDVLMSDLADLVKRTRAGSLKSSEMADPTLTVTNLGDQGVEVVHGVIYPPQVALVGFGRIVERPWADDGALRVVRAVTVSLAADHRVSDGHRGALFLAEIAALLQQPEQL